MESYHLANLWSSHNFEKVRYGYLHGLSGSRFLLQLFIYGDMPILQDDLCAICLDGTVMDDNEIIFCDKCSVPVHQACYHVSRIPSGHW